MFYKYFEIRANILSLDDINYKSPCFDLDENRDLFEVAGQNLILTHSKYIKSINSESYAKEHVVLFYNKQSKDSLQISVPVFWRFFHIIFLFFGI